MRVYKVKDVKVKEMTDGKDIWYVGQCPDCEELANEGEIHPCKNGKPFVFIYEDDFNEL